MYIGLRCLGGLDERYDDLWKDLRKKPEGKFRFGSAEKDYAGRILGNEVKISCNDELLKDILGYGEKFTVYSEGYNVSFSVKKEPGDGKYIVSPEGICMETGKSRIFRKFLEKLGIPYEGKDLGFGEAPKKMNENEFVEWLKEIGGEIKIHRYYPFSIKVKEKKDYLELRMRPVSKALEILSKDYELREWEPSPRTREKMKNFAESYLTPFVQISLTLGLFGAGVNYALSKLAGVPPDPLSGLMVGEAAGLWLYLMYLTEKLTGFEVKREKERKGK